MLATEADYHAWFLRLCGILADPIAASRLLAAATARGEKLKGGFGYRQAYKNRLGVEDLAAMQKVISALWGGRPEVLDPTAGGGSIPYEAIRLGFSTYANDLNPVAAAILSASLTIPGE
jgi:putative DNA methylase